VRGDGARVDCRSAAGGSEDIPALGRGRETVAWREIAAQCILAAVAEKKLFWSRELSHLADDEIERASNQRYLEVMKRKPTASDFRTKMNARAARRQVELIKTRRGIFDDDPRAEAEAAWDKARKKAKVMFKQLIGKIN
jgi:hypothetical protein